MPDFFHELNALAKYGGIEYVYSHADFLEVKDKRFVLTKNHTSSREVFLYHYTSQETAFEILKKFTIRASDAFFLNDSLEIEIGRRALEAALKRANLLDSDPVDQQLIKAITFLTQPREINGTKLLTYERQRAYTACFSTLPDDLSQWRGYAGSEGVALGFNVPLISSTTPDALLAPVLYGDEEKFTKLLYDDILNVQSSLQSIHTRIIEANRHDLYVYLVRWYLLILPLMKSDSFERECEWRLVLTEAEVTRSKADWRPGRRYAVPYVDLQLKGKISEAGYLNLSEEYSCEAILGPEAHSLAMHFYDHRLGIGRCKQSGINFRS